MILEDKIKKIIHENGHIAVDDFMNIALFDESEGYYIKKNPIGASEDFITAPEISRVFGECLAGFIAVQIRENLKDNSQINLVELGAGRGTLLNDILDTLNQFNDIYQKISCYILDVNEPLVEIQKNTFINHIDKVKWIKNINEIGALPVIFIANEFFDALPIKQYIKTNNEIKERVIKFDARNDTGFYFDFIDAKIPNFIEEDKHEFLEKNVMEFSQISIDFIDQISQKILSNSGVAIIIDYGHVNFASGDSLQSIYKHEFNNLFQHIGKADITSHVNFRLLYARLKNNGVEKIHIQNQGDFLRSLGIIERTKILEKNLSGDNEKKDLYLRLNRLINKNEMGDLFKCLIAEHF